jgi:hypothetical protein
VATSRSSHAGTAFINLAYVNSNEDLFLGLLAGLAGFGLVPVAAMHDPGSDPQLSRIYRLIEQSVISFHDLSYVRLDPPSPRTPRFNMPFELGLAVPLRCQPIVNIAGFSSSKSLIAPRNRLATSAGPMC